MKINYLLFPLLVALASCGNSKKQETSVPSDSTQLEQTVAPVDNTVQAEQSVPTAAADGNSFPSYSLEYLSADPKEASITESLEELMNSYNSKKYLTIQGHRSREWEYDGEYDKVTANEEETNTWYYDANYKLRAYSNEYTRNSTGDGRDAKIIIYLFSNDSLKGGYDNWNQDNQIGMQYQKRILASKCPDCGTNITKEAGGSAQINYLTADDLQKLNLEFLQRLSQLHIDINRAWNKAVADGDHSTVDIEYAQQERYDSPIVNYTVQYSVNNELYKKYISRNP